MLKVYEWLVYNFMRPHKKFQHFIKWFDICFIRTTTNINKKKKGKIKQREKEKLPPRRGRAPPLQPAQPTRTPLSSSPGRRTHSCVATMPWPPTSPQATSCFPSPSPRVWRLRTAVLIHFPLCSSSSSPSYVRFHRSPRARRSAPPWQTWPPCPRGQADVSLVLAVVDFFFPKQAEP